RFVRNEASGCVGFFESPADDEFGHEGTYGERGGALQCVTPDLRLLWRFRLPYHRAKPCRTTGINQAERRGKGQEFMKRINGFAGVARLALAACSGAQKPDEAGSASGESVAPAGETEAGASTALTPEYLAGDWCYRRFEAGDEVSEENIT